MAGKPGFKTALISLILAALVLALAGSARAQGGEASLFYDALAPYGSWVEYGNYGPVWYPTQVAADWRPYLDGRWVPTAEGWVFESQEPWAWACYHYGNWFPTDEYGWVWSPGSTWYPSTAAWRTNDDYIGWAPIPPAGYVPTIPAFFPARGFFPGITPFDLLSPPCWIFARSSSFLLGFGLPFLPTFSFFNCGCCAPFTWLPVIFPQTFLLSNFFSPIFAPGGFFVFGPAFPFVARVTGVNIVQINNFASSVNITNIQGAVPSTTTLTQSPFLRQVVPDPVLSGQRFAVQAAHNAAAAKSQLVRANVVPPPANVPPLTAVIPKVVTAPPATAPARGAGPEAWRGLKAVTLPGTATLREGAPGAAPRAAPASAGLPRVMPAPGRAQAVEGGALTTGERERLERARPRAVTPAGRGEKLPQVEKITPSRPVRTPAREELRVPSGAVRAPGAEMGPQAPVRTPAGGMAPGEAGRPPVEELRPSRPPTREVRPSAPALAPGPPQELRAPATRPEAAPMARPGPAPAPAPRPEYRPAPAPAPRPAPAAPMHEPGMLMPR